MENRLKLANNLFNRTLNLPRKSRHPTLTEVSSGKTGFTQDVSLQ
jgi:hypothetical protein